MEVFGVLFYVLQHKIWEYWEESFNFAVKKGGKEMAKYGIEKECTEHVKGLRIGGGEENGAVPEGVLYYEAEGIWKQTSNYEVTVYVTEFPLADVNSIRVSRLSGVPDSVELELGALFNGEAVPVEDYSMASPYRYEIEGVFQFYDGQGDLKYLDVPGVRLKRPGSEDTTGGEEGRCRIVGVISGRKEGR